jgi:hypothetical protein
LLRGGRPGEQASATSSPREAPHIRKATLATAWRRPGGKLFVAWSPVEPACFGPVSEDAPASTTSVVTGSASQTSASATLRDGMRLLFRDAMARFENELASLLE